MALVELTTAAIATLVITKALEKAGEKLGEKTIEQGGKLVQILRRKSPDTASAIEQVRLNPQLVEQQPENYSVEVLTRKVEEAAKTNPEISEAVRSTADAVKAQPQSNQNITNIAEKIVGNIQGGVIGSLTQTFNV